MQYCEKYQGREKKQREQILKHSIQIKIFQSTFCFYIQC